MSRSPSLEYLDVEKLSAAALGLAAVAALVLANSPLAGGYFDFVKAELTFAVGGWTQTHSVLGWTKEGLMAVFFLVVGLEIKHEILHGALSTRGQLALPVAAAAGGMAGPALIYLLVNASGGRPEGWPIPTATDIAFAAAALALVGRGLPPALRTFLLTLAVVDDLGAVTLIAVLFSRSVDGLALCGVAGVLALLGLLGRWRRAPPALYLVGFAAVWLLMLQSGLSTSLAGVLTAAMVPAARTGTGATSTLKRLMWALHPLVAFAILPFFAFVAAGVSLRGLAWSALLAPVTLGVTAGLLVGKPLGVMTAVWSVIRLGWGRAPAHATRLELCGIALLCGVGFTMSLFIGGLAFPEHEHALNTEVKLGVLAGSVLSTLAGGVVLWFAARRRRLKAIA
jgi:NhaA family Na+:H+ antiporter